MLAGEAAPIVQLPCVKPKLTCTVGNGVRAAAGRAGHVCQGCPRRVTRARVGDAHGTASCRAENRPPAPTAFLTEGAGHRLYFFHQIL